jgi:hypothetical protein
VMKLDHGDPGPLIVAKANILFCLAFINCLSIRVFLDIRYNFIFKSIPLFQIMQHNLVP